MYRDYQEYLQTPQFKAIRVVVFNRAKNICELCHSKPGVDPHHIRYPKWGTFDTPENLIVLCRECHCFLHGKDK